MEWQIPIVILIVAACAYLAFREIKKELTGKSKCSGCSGRKQQKPIQIQPPLNSKKNH